jgi:superfamily II DNA or RNA helicase
MNVLFDFDTVKRKAQIISPHLAEIRELFSVEDKAQIFLRRRFGRNIPIRKYAFTNKGYFDTPFFEELCKEIKINFPQAEIKATPDFLQVHNVPSIAEKYEELKFQPRDYQHESVLGALKAGRGVIVLPTSAGKTLVIGLIANTCVTKNLKVLILVPNIQLVQQTYSDFVEYGIDEKLFSKWTGNHEFSNTNIVIANNQILLSEKQDINVLKNFDLVIVDECHKMASAEKITKLIKDLNSRYILGFTGSLPESKFDVWSINRIFGSIIYYKKSVELRKEQYISKVRVACLELDYKNIPEFARPSIDNPTAGYEEETNWLQTHSFRTEIIYKVVNSLDTNTLILVDRIAHGEYLQEQLKLKLRGTDKQVYFIQGSLEVEEREKIRQMMEENNNIVCIAISKIFSTGISIKNLHNVIFAAIGKARIKIIQSIGRTLRLHHTKEVATIFDIADTCLTYGFKHYVERKRLYELEKIPITSTMLVES